MPAENDIYPDCPAVVRTVDVGGLAKPDLLRELQKHAISMNELAERLFASDRFAVSETRYSLTTVELTVRELGFPRGATTVDTLQRAGELDLGPCPLELGPYLRLQVLDQPEGYDGKPVWRHRAPYGSITIASERPCADDDFPRGFYLRRMEGVLWLRGYRSGDRHLWDADDHLVFCRT